jgi:succinate dehydrogenase cytochrome b subunit
MTTIANRIPFSFILRRLHSLTGVFLALYLFEHLLTNSQAALYLGDNGKGFIDAVNWIHSLPFLGAIEIFLLGVPIAVHLLWGIQYLFTSAANSYPANGTKPSLTQYARNHAYTWQRITSWVLVFGLLGHVIHMRFVEYPAIQTVNGKTNYSIRVEKDPGLISLANRLGVQLVESNGQMIVVANDFGTADLFVVRETFKMPIMVALYTLFVLAACYHGYNGLWTAMITWGVTLTERSQMWMRWFTVLLMALVAFFGLSAIFGT